MGSFQLFGKELKSLKNRKGLLFALIGVMLIPIVYVAVLLSATWGPYDNLDNLPVAVVNKDAGGVSSGQPINVGNDLVDTLKESKTLGWEFVSEEEALKGLDNQKYYMVVEIPEDFSQKVTTVLDANPQVPELRYIQNEGLNYMGSQVTNSAVERIREQLGDKITATYARTVFSKFTDIETGFTTGADGSQQINEGTAQLAEGTNTLLTSLTEKSADINKLADGAKTADAGAGELLAAITGGTGDINKLANGSQQVAAGAGSLKSGSQQVLTGLQSLQGGSNQVYTGLQQLQPGSESLLTGLQQLQAGANQLYAGVALGDGTASNPGLANGLNQLATVLQSKQGDIEQLAAGAQLLKGLASAPGLETYSANLQALSTGLSELGVIYPIAVQSANALNNGAQQIAQSMPALTTGLDQAVVGQKTIVSGVNALVGGQGQAVAGINQLVSGQKAVVAGASQLESGASQVAGGNKSLTGSWGKLGAGVTSLKTGLEQISVGNETVATGWQTMTEGVTSLNDGANRLQAGSTELTTGLAGGAEQVAAIRITDDNIAMFSSPVVLAGEKVNKYEYYRDSTAPYILSLALFVGMLILSFFVEFKKPAVLPKSAMSWYVSKWLQLALFATVQALLVSIFTLVVLQLSVQNVMMFILFAILVSITFMSIVFFLVSAAGNVGRFIGLVLVVAQLSITGSNLPIPMLPENLRSLSSLLPFTYSNSGFKSAISLGDLSLLSANSGVLAIFLIGASILAFVAFVLGYKSLTTKYKPEVQPTV
ncbi:YhgE/Pip domain-containing protein [Lysinibacillus sp. 2017]|uniref:YhgE/Pip domain-containing protein n=1 Tax=unclassified Lysinibacillus TaxID=2636778 RepID=UPI000D5278B9|nr:MULTISPECIES: YhgE/Pip domain-containing protein [unclassified Lysinibacillus]AWE07552.1 YhgE/Pip domain-containing protein [Lysinibacillus sp. 2017]TGN36715.1 YhgE/Pip domain-containing protein [Lysinibacillus sp. S2017]